MTAAGLTDFLCDALQALGSVMPRRMFSGVGLFCDGLMFGLVFGDTLYLKADAQTQAAFEAEGMTPFVYEAKKRIVSLNYWRAPERLLDDPDDLLDWSRAALAVAHRKASAKAKGRRDGARKSRPPSPLKPARKPSAKGSSARRQKSRQRSK